LVGSGTPYISVSTTLHFAHFTIYAFVILNYPLVSEQVQSVA